MKKGVSPIVAAVVLLAVAITVGVTVSTWISSWVATQTSPEALSCSVKTYYIIDSAKFNNSDDNLLLVKVTNKGEEKLYGFGMYIDNGTLVKYYNSTHGNLSVSPSVSSTNPLAREQNVYLTLDLRIDGISNESLQGYYKALLTSLSEVKVTNEACDSVSAKTETISQGS